LQCDGQTQTFGRRQMAFGADTNTLT